MCSELISQFLIDWHDLQSCFDPRDSNRSLWGRDVLLRDHKILWSLSHSWSGAVVISAGFYGFYFPDGSRATLPKHEFLSGRTHHRLLQDHVLEGKTLFLPIQFNFHVKSFKSSCDLAGFSDFGKRDNAINQLCFSHHIKVFTNDCTLCKKQRLCWITMYQKSR